MSLTVVIGAQAALLVFFIVCSAYFSSAETAITSLDEGRLSYLVSAHKKKRRAFSALLKEPNNLITALLILNNLTNVGASSLMTLVVLRFFAKGIPNYQVGLLATGIMTVSLLIFGEITPKNFAKKNAERYALATINQIYFFSRLLWPLIVMFRWLAYRIVRLFGEDLSQEEPMPVSDEQIETLIDASEERGLLDVEDGEMIRRILSFDEMTANQVMIPRPDVQLIEAETPLTEAREIVIKDGHSRFPVYEQTPDNIVGTLYAKDLLAPTADSHTSLRDMLRPVYYTPTSKPINVLLREFQRKRVHMAVVIDEFSGMAGIITLEDILEEIVGEIEDEYDHPIMLIKRISPDEALIDGDTSIHQLNQAMDLDLPEDKGVTINGLLFHFLAAMPKNGQQVTIGPVTITVEKATERESTSVRVKTSRMVQEEEETGNEK